jgi:Lrp/AsnC family leucine-responsive transcriptional regulator
MKDFAALDPSDADILTVLQRNNRLSLDDLAAEVHLSPASVHRRLKRLRKDRVIVADVSVVDPAKVGRPMTIIMLVNVERDSPNYVAPFVESIRSDPIIMQCYAVTGDADYVLIATVRDMTEYEDFTRRYFSGNSNVRHFQTMVALDRVKTGLTVPVELSPREHP